MITVELSRSLNQGGVLWEPAPGDRFTIDPVSYTHLTLPTICSV